MSKLGDDLIQSLKEAVDHAKGEGPGIKHAPGSPSGSEADDGEAETTRASDDAEPGKAALIGSRESE